MLTDTPTTDFELFGDRLECALARVEMRQTKLAAKLGIRPQAISFLVNGGSPQYRGEHSQKMAEILGVPELWLIRNEGTPPADMPHPHELSHDKRSFRNGARCRLALARRDAVPTDSESALPKTQLHTTVAGLNHLQMATLEKLSVAMSAGNFSDAECLEILMRLEKSIARGSPTLQQEQRSTF